MTQELYWLALTLALTCLLPFPYVLNRITVRGLGGALANPSATDEPLSGWAQRAQRAHANAVENLAVFAPAVLALHLSGRGDGMTAASCAVYFFARLAHYAVYTLGVPGLRTLSYFAGWGATAAVAARIVGLL